MFSVRELITTHSQLSTKVLYTYSVVPKYINRAGRKNQQSFNLIFQCINYDSMTNYSQVFHFYTLLKTSISGSTETERGPKNVYRYERIT